MLSVVVPTGYVGMRTRLDKLCVMLSQDGVPYEFVGWLRDGDSDEYTTVPDVPTRHLIQGGAYSSVASRMKYLLWLVRAYRYARRSTTDAFYCIGIETALPIALGKRDGAHLIFDNADNLSKSFNFDPVTRRLVEAAERFVARRATAHIVPNSYRWEANDDNLHVIINTPSREAFEQAKALGPISDSDGAYVVYVNGWLGEQRGIRQIIEAARLLVDRSDIRFWFAGRCTDDVQRDIEALSNADYYGQIPNVESLRRFAGSNIVLTLYDPAIEINRIAAPNKWGDCVFTGTPFIVNEEVVPAQEFIHAGACKAYPYGNQVALADLVSDLSDSTNGKQDALEAGIESLRGKFDFWDRSMHQVLVDELGLGVLSEM